MQKVLFIDRDGTLIEEPPDHQVDDLGKIRLVRDVVCSLLRLRDAGFRFIMVTNQDGLGTEAFPEADFERCQRQVVSLFESQGITFDRIFVCPHTAADNCGCRKPRAGLLTQYLASSSLDLRHCAVIGDRDSDVQLAANIGVPGLLLDTNNGFETSWPGIVERLTATERLSTVERKTRETRIRVTVNIDTEAPVVISTGIGFYDHMLEQIAKHGGFSLRLESQGDLEVDEHHTVEDTAICLGEALRSALGGKRGIGRYGFVLPMDESEARVALDLSGRAWFELDGRFPRNRVGGLPTELVAHFFRSLADALGATLHIEVRGENAHHMVEACFKAVGRALRQAIRREGDEMPSTKGSLS